MRSRILRFILVFAVGILLSAAALVPPAHASGSKPKSELSAGADNAYYITMAPMILPVMNDSGIQEVVSVVVALEVKNQETMEKVNRLVPKLKDAYMRGLYGKLDNHAYRNGQFLDVTRLRGKIATITDVVVGKGEVDSVLIQGVNQRHFN